MHQNILYSNSRAISIKTRIETWVRFQRKLHTLHGRKKSKKLRRKLFQQILFFIKKQSN